MNDEKYYKAKFGQISVSDKYLGAIDSFNFLFILPFKGRNKAYIWKINQSGIISKHS